MGHLGLLRETFTLVWTIMNNYERLLPHLAVTKHTCMLKSMAQCLALYDVLLHFKCSKGFRMMRLSCHFKKERHRGSRHTQTNTRPDTPSALRHGFNLMPAKKKNSLIHFIPFKGCFVKSINRCHCHAINVTWKSILSTQTFLSFKALAGLRTRGGQNTAKCSDYCEI